jgi:hypothetical protein
MFLTTVLFSGHLFAFGYLVQTLIQRGDVFSLVFGLGITTLALIPMTAVTLGSSALMLRGHWAISVALVLVGTCGVLVFERWFSVGFQPLPLAMAIPVLGAYGVAHGLALRWLGYRITSRRERDSAKAILASTT